MTNRLMRQAVAGVAGLLLAALCHGAGEDIIDRRAGQMKAAGEQLKGVARLLEAGGAPAQAADAARELRALAARIPELFPPGSAAPHSDARPAIWDEWAPFLQAAAALDAAARALEQAADRAALAAAYERTLAACKGCHRRWRAR